MGCGCAKRREQLKGVMRKAREELHQRLKLDRTKKRKSVGLGG